MSSLKITGLLQKVNNWTPCFDFINRKYKGKHNYGLILGRIWRYTQLENGVCNASMVTMARDLGISYKTFLSAVKILETDGYLIDETPDLKNHPHTYRIAEDLLERDSAM